VISGEIASQIGLMSGDIILSVDNLSVNNQTIGSVLKQQVGKTIPLTYVRNGEQKTATISCPSERCVLGILMKDDSNQQTLMIKYPFFMAAGKAAHEIRAQAKLTFPALGGIIRNAVSSKKIDRQQALQNLS